MDYIAMARRANKTATDKGFWEQGWKGRDLGEMMMLAISELAEALEEDRDSKPELYYYDAGVMVGLPRPVGVAGLPQGRKPEGFCVEIADCMIRCFDTIYMFCKGDNAALEVVFRTSRRMNSFDTPATGTGDELRRMSMSLAMTAEPGLPERLKIFALGEIIFMCERLIMRRRGDVEAIVDAKMKYNETRPYKHGKKY